MIRSALLTTILVILPAGLGLSPALAKDTINLPLPGDPRPRGRLQEAANDSANAEESSISPRDLPLIRAWVRRLLPETLNFTP